MGVRSTDKSYRGQGENKRLDGYAIQFFNSVRTGGGSNVSPAVSGITATGGVISDYTDDENGNIYRAHIFTSAGEFTVSSVTGPGAVEYLVVGGGGGGGMVYRTDAGGAGGGAGGFRSSVLGETSGGGSGAEGRLIVTQSPGTYTIKIGAGGKGINHVNTGVGGTGAPGGPSYIINPGIASITSFGGGGGGGWILPNPENGTMGAGGVGGSGGGGAGWTYGNPGGANSFYDAPAPSISPQGFPGGLGDGSRQGAVAAAAVAQAAVACPAPETEGDMVVLES